MHTLLWILLSVFIVSSVSVIGILFIAFRKNMLRELLFVMVALASGVMLGDAFLHLLPESYEGCSCSTVFLIALLSIVIFFILEKILYWRHCHEEHCEIHAFTYLNLIGDGFHNFIDGLIIATGFITSIHIGMMTTIAILLHEVPQEIGDFGVLIHGGFSKKKALLFNFLSALTSVGGALFGYFLSSYVIKVVPFLLAFAAGGFIYIASSDLIPELHKTTHFKSSMIQLFFLISGIGLVWFLK